MTTSPSMLVALAKLLALATLQALAVLALGQPLGDREALVGSCRRQAEAYLLEVQPSVRTLLGAISLQLVREAMVAGLEMLRPLALLPLAYSLPASCLMAV